MSIDLVKPYENSISYTDGYKYQLERDAAFNIPSLAAFPCVKTDYLEVMEAGVLVIRKGYAWDGPSGPTIDTKNAMRGSLVHDALYQLMRLDLIPRSYRETADKIIEALCELDGMWSVRAKVWERMLRRFGGVNVLASRRKQIQYAP